MKKSNEQLDNPANNKNEQAFDDQRRKTMEEGENETNELNVADDEEEDGSPILDEADLEENHISDDEADKIEWSPEGNKDTDKTSSKPQPQNKPLK